MFVYVIPLCCFVLKHQYYAICNPLYRIKAGADTESDSQKALSQAVEQVARWLLCSS